MNFRSAEEKDLSELDNLLMKLVEDEKINYDKYLEHGIINEKQLEMLNGFFANPDETMRNFLIAHPEFLENALNSDEKNKKRAQLLIDGDLYGLNN